MNPPFCPLHTAIRHRVLVAAFFALAAASCDAQPPPDTAPKAKPEITPIPPKPVVTPAPASQPPAPTPTLTPMPATSPTPGSKPTPATAATPEPVPGATPAPPASGSTAGKATPKSLVDSLSKTELQEVIKGLKANFINADTLTEEELARATVAGLLSRLGPGAMLLPGRKAAEQDAQSPFRSELLDRSIGYVRLGSLATTNVQELDAALQTFVPKKLSALILDLRATPISSEFDAAAEVAKRFTPKGKPLFTLKKPSVKQERLFTSNQEPVYQGLLIVLVDQDTGGAAEVIAAVLRHYSKAMVIGDTTAGKAVEYADVLLSGDAVLRIAVSAVVLPEDVSLFPTGLQPDLAVKMDPEVKKTILEQSLDKGVGPFIYDVERPRMNEAALVAGTNPELDALQAAQRNKGKEKPAALRDPVLQRAVDLVTTIAIFGKRPGGG